MPSKQQGIGRALLDFQFPRALDKPFLRFRTVPLFARHPVSIPAERIRFRDTIQEIRLAPPGQTPKRSLTDFVALLEKLTRLEMLSHKRDSLRAHVITVDRVYFDAIEKTLRRQHPRFLVPARAPTPFDELSCSRLPKIMSERRQHDRHLPRVGKIVD